MKTVLLACSQNGRGPVFELPYVLKKAGLHVTLMCDAKTRGLVSSRHDVWIEAPEDARAVVAQAAALVTKNPAAFDWVILGDDKCLKALADAPLDMNLKLRFSPMRNPEHFAMLGSKIDTARLLRAHGVLMPPSRSARSIAEAARTAAEIGFPVILKIENSSGGEGVFKCHSEQDVLACPPWAHNQPLLVEKFIEGDLASVEPLFMNGKLITYAYSTVIATAGFGVSSRRLYRPCPALKEPLEAMAKTFALHGFANLGYIHEKNTGVYYLIEADLRPNAWIASTRLAGIDMSAALKAHGAGTPPPVQNQAVIVSLPHREIRNFIHQKQFLSLFFYVCNPFNWRFIPFHDPKLVFTQLQRLGDFLLKPLQKLAPMGTPEKQI